MLKIYDTKLREKVPFESLEHGKIGMYVCGPTVYNYIHIGNSVRSSASTSSAATSPGAAST